MYRLFCRIPRGLDPVAGTFRQVNKLVYFIICGVHVWWIGLNTCCFDWQINFGVNAGQDLCFCVEVYP